MPPIAGLFALLLAANGAAWLWAFAAFHDRPVLLGTALLAWSLGLRHAVDADHIAAIDNVTRKLMQASQRPVSVGLYFALGHSAVVAAAVTVLAAATPSLAARLDGWREIGGLIGTLVSAFFLFAIAVVNLLLLRSLWRARDGVVAPDTASGGALARLCRPLFGLIARPWQMVLLGILFGLGFDTATEIALLALTATQATEGLAVGTVLVFPALFASAMSLVDTADGALMLRAYGWAFAKPVRRLYYNLTITLISVVVALAIGSLELLGLVNERLARVGPFWDGIGQLNDKADTLGFLIIGLFVSVWIGAIVLYRHKRVDGAVGAD